MIWKPCIQHWKCRGEEALERLRQNGSNAGCKVSICVCDANDDMEKSVELMRTFVANDLFERPCLVVVTFKMTCRSKKDFAERKVACMSALERECGLSNMEELHLFANTRMETT